MRKFHRSTIAVYGEFSTFVENTKDCLRDAETLWMSDDLLECVPITPFAQAQHKLGQEVDVVVFDASKALAANALGAVSGCIRGGGILLLVLPEGEDSVQTSLIYQRIENTLKRHAIPPSPFKLNSLERIKRTIRDNLDIAATDSTTVTPTKDQIDAIQAINKTLRGHRNRPAVITSQRGRGKSSAIGMAIRKLQENRPFKAIVCAPTRAMISPIIRFASETADIDFYPPDRLISELPDAGLLVIDEAGAIPVPILTKALKHYSRVVFSSTTHGYEGNGRGFAIRFQDQLDRLTPDWRATALETPIRWAKNDPLEAFINNLLLLDADTSTLGLSGLDNSKVSYHKLTPKELASDESKLRQFFGLFVSAHYQTKPSDLVQLLTDSFLSIHTLQTDSQIVTAAIVSHEGGLSNELAEAVYTGERRPKGHLVPQILLAQMGILEAATLSCDRIMRIATHADCRGKMMASQLLENITTQSKADYLSTSYGLSAQLFSFWKRNGYRAVYLGQKREASSGYHSVTMLKPQTDAGSQLYETAQRAFARNFVAHLGDSLKAYDPYLAYLLVSDGQPYPINLFNQEIRDITRFISNQCGLESSLASIQRWLPVALKNDKQIINNNEAILLIMRILQHHDWQHCCTGLGLTGKKQAQQLLQKTLTKYAANSADLDVSKDGLTQR